MITKREALEHCRDLWAWLSETGSEDKAEWPGWLDLEFCLFLCPCCEYVEQRRGGIAGERCAICPLAELWPEDPKNGLGWCQSDDSPFSAWDITADPRLRSKYAGMIEDAAIKALEKLEKEEKDE